MEGEYAEEKCSACKKPIKTEVIQCKSCVKMFYHPGCVSKHKTYDINKELVQCQGPFVKFIIGNEIEEVVKKTTGATDRLGSSGTSGIPNASNNGSINMDTKIDWLVRTVKEIKDETICKKEIKAVIKEIIQVELKDVKQ